MPGDDSSAVRMTIARIAHAMDRAEDVADLTALFDEHAVLTLSARSPAEQTHSSIRGRSAIEEWVRARRAAGAQGPASGTRHIVTNEIIEFDSPDRVRATAYFMYLAAQGPQDRILATGIYEDVLMRTGGRWLLAERTILS